MAKIHLIGTALVAAAVVAGCNKNASEQAPAEEVKEAAAPALAADEDANKDPNEVMVTVNGEKLTRGDIAADVAKVIAAQGDKIPAEQAAYARRMIANQIAQTFLVEKVLVAKAQKLGYEIKDEDLKEREAEFLKSVANQPNAPKSIAEAAEKAPLGKDRTMAEFRNGILIDKMLKGEAISKNVKDYTAEAQKTIDNIVSNNTAAAKSEGEILTKIQDLKKQLDATPADKVAEKFAELAKANSACPSSAKGGDLDFFAKGMMVPEFEKVAFELPVGKVSEPVKTKFGYHLIMVTDKKDAVEAKGETPAEPAKVRASHILLKGGETQEVPKLEEVVNFMKRRDERQVVNEYIVKSLREAQIEVADDYKNLLPPPEEKPEVPVETPAEK